MMHTRQHPGCGNRKQDSRLGSDTKVQGHPRLQETCLKTQTSKQMNIYYNEITEDHGP